ncbi:P2Y purinoceptor 1-like [Saccostrea cucullata]|uniref:P2Y purinoceptor 1-like n=1 Tax=Saccostrea cuccullata TaxID=36930 RepID=UPI002ED67A69
MRYLLTVHPLRSKARLTTSIVICCSLMVWILCLLFSVFILLMILWAIKASSDEIELLLIIYVLMRITLCGLIPICVILALHFLKRKALRKSSVTNSISRRMDVIVSIILSVFIYFQISQLLYSVVVLSFFFSDENSPFTYTHEAFTFDIGIIFGFLNFSCNPYILFFSSMILTHKKGSLTKNP